MPQRRDDAWYDAALAEHGAWLQTSPSLHAVMRRVGCSRDRALTLFRLAGVERVPRDPRRGNRSPRPRKTAAVAVESTDPEPGYEYERRADDDGPVYVFTFPGRSDALVLPEHQVEAMLVDYTSWDGQQHTMDQVARANGLTRNEFYGVKRALGWTKTALPLLPHQQEELDEDAAAAHLLALKMRGAEVKARRQSWRQTEQDAQRWRDYERGRLRPLERVVATLSDSYQPPRAKIVVRPKSQRRYALVLCATDLHVGKLHDTINGGGPAVGLDTARQRLTEAIADVLASLPREPECIFFQVGGDWFNSDTSGGTTTKGTPQDNAATPERIAIEALTLAKDAVYLLREVAPVRVRTMPGNHDALSCVFLAEYLGAWFRADERVSVAPYEGAHAADVYGANLLYWHHGDGVGRPKDCARVMATTWPRLWGQTRHRYAFTGHLHHAHVEEAGGITFFRLPSLSGDDRWHVREGYTDSAPALLGIALDHERGWWAGFRAVAA